ncbi:hypothetical protein SUGI_0570880 [Cryptomeria japonica]|nr:hypothetical protein SUGI_0570880 [Cryptomeria japonica]
MGKKAVCVKFFVRFFITLIIIATFAAVETVAQDACQYYHCQTDSDCHKAGLGGSVCCNAGLSWCGIGYGFCGDTTGACY